MTAEAPSGGARLIGIVPFLSFLATGVYWLDRGNDAWGAFMIGGGCFGAGIIIGDWTARARKPRKPLMEMLAFRAGRVVRRCTRRSGAAPPRTPR